MKYKLVACWLVYPSGPIIQILTTHQLELEFSDNMIFILWLFVWLFSILHPFLNGIYLILLNEYETYHMTSIEFSQTLNIMLRIEYFSHAALFVVLMIFFSHTKWALLLNLPILIYHIKKFFDGSYLVNPAELYNEVKQRRVESIVKVVYGILMFAFYLFSFVMAVIAYEAENKVR